MGERERECREREREVADARQRAREAEDMVGDLESRVRAAEREAKVSSNTHYSSLLNPSLYPSQELQRQLREAQIGAEEDAANRARDLRVSLITTLSLCCTCTCTGYGGEGEAG